MTFWLAVHDFPPFICANNAQEDWPN